MADHFDIPLGNGYFLVAERNSDPKYDREIFIGVTDGNGVWFQDLAIVRSAFKCVNSTDGTERVWEPDRFEVLVYASENIDDFTHEYSIWLRRDTAI